MTTAKGLTDLPPELLEHIVDYLPSANSLAHLSQSNRSLHTFVEKDAWQTFCKLRFPSLCPTISPSFKDTARTLTSLSRAWDRRAFVARYTEPYGDITAFPGGKKVDRWKRPKGQTIGFTPHLDVYEEDAGSGGRREVLAYSAGAEVCLRVREWQRGKSGKSKEHVRWKTYRPLTASEGRDDVTTLHLLRDRNTHDDGHRLITGTANGDLQLLDIPSDPSQDVSRTYLTTQGQPVRSSSLLQRDTGPSLLAAEIGDSRICLYSLSDDQVKIAPDSQIDVKPAAQSNGTRVSKAYRAWSTNLLSERHLAVGLGPSEEPIQVYNITPTGISDDNVRKFSLQATIDLEDRSDEIAPGGVARRPMSSVYPIASLPASSAAASSQESQVFLSGAYDGVTRLHDMRSSRDVEGIYSDPTDDNPIYSLLPRGQETLLAGTSRHNLLKVFDLRLGTKCYSYLGAHATSDSDSQPISAGNDWSLFLKPHSGSSTNTNHSWSSRRSVESSIYSLASASSASPHVYAGVENNVVELAFTDVLDRNPDTAHFKRWDVTQSGKGGSEWNGWRTKEVLDLACYDQNADMRLCAQKSLWETWRTREKVMEDAVPGLDSRWKSGGS